MWLVGGVVRRFIDILIITSKRYSVGARRFGRMQYWCNMSVITCCNLAVSITISVSSATTHLIAFTYCSVDLADL